MALCGNSVGKSSSIGGRKWSSEEVMEEENREVRRWRRKKVERSDVMK